MKTYNIRESHAFILDQCVHLMRTKCRKILQQCGSKTTVEEYSLLVVLLSKDGLRVKDLAHLMRRDATTITRQLDGLAKKNLVRREPDSTDRRATLIRLTSLGRREIKNSWDDVAKFGRHSVDGVTASDLEATLRTVKKIQENLDRFDVAQILGSDSANSDSRR